MHIFMCPLCPLLLSPSVPTTYLQNIQIKMAKNYMNSILVILVIGSKSTNSKTDICSLLITEATIPVSTQVWCTLNSPPSFSSHINKGPFPFVISRLCLTLTQHSIEVLGNALVMSHINNCNMILAGIPNKRTHQLQLIQNSVARIIA